jgi:hypothetical protein
VSSTLDKVDSSWALRFAGKVRSKCNLISSVDQI